MTKKKGKLRAKKVKKIVISDPSSPLVFVDIALKAGSTMDPEGKEGVSSLTASMLLRGTKNLTAEKFHEKLDDIGGELFLGRYMESTRLVGECLAENADKFFDLIEQVLAEPSFEESEFKKLKNQSLSRLKDELSDDDAIADRRFQEYSLAGHKYGRLTGGSLESVENISPDDLKSYYDKFYGSANTIFSATGGLSKKNLELKLDRLSKAFNNDVQEIDSVEAPKFPKGRQLHIIEKPNRTQSQIVIGAQGIGYENPNYHEIIMANHILGGSSFSAWLMKEVREKRGWSYGAYSFYRNAKNPLYFMASTTPSNKDTVGAVELILKLLKKFSKGKISKSEFDFAKKSLVNQSAFLQDTIKKRLGNKVSEDLLDLKKGFFDDYQARLKKVTYKGMLKAIERHLNFDDLYLLVLGTPDEWSSELEKLPKLKEVTRTKFDEQP